MKKLILGTAIAALATTGAYAEDYQFELGASYVTGDLGGVDYDGFGFYGEFHFDSVDTSKGPLNEAAFLDKSSSVVATYATSEADVPGAESVDAFGAAVRYVTSSDWIVEAAYTDLNGDDTALGLGIGAYISDTMDVVVSYETFDEADESSLTADLHSVNALGGEAALAYDVSVSYLDVGEETGYAIGGGVDYYFNKQLSVGASLELASVDETDVSTLGLNVTYFVAPAIGLAVDFETLGQDGDGDSIVLSGAVRF